jgi:2-polyprenyl-6-methoxyphenol hydroxylase-like FAD-dependent oxidoreductase
VDVVIVGAGIGGLALARGLQADGHRVEVLEKAAGRRDGGAAVTIFSNGGAADGHRSVVRRYVLDPSRPAQTAGPAGRG